MKPLVSAVIHESAMVHPTARLGIGVVIGPNVVVGENVSIGHYASVGGMPEHKTWYTAGDEEFERKSLGVYLEAGSRVFEFATIHAGTRRPTRLCPGAVVFNHSHVAHDCWIGPDVIVGGQVTLAGHTILGRGSTISGKSCTHQFSVVGAFAFIGAMSYLKGNVPPGEKWMGNPARAAGLNDVGLERAGLSHFECRWRHGEEFEMAIKEAK